VPKDNGARNQSLHARLRNLSDNSWLQMLIASLDSRDVAGMRFPGFPSSAVQMQFTGSANVQTLQEAFGFYTLIKDSCVKFASPLGSEHRLLDFGVGWGRFLRMFIKDIAAENLHGCDIDPSVIALCRELGLPGNLDRTYPGGRLPYPDAYFDAICSYSVFTHLPEPVHMHWMGELARVAKHGCVFVLTLEPRSFIDFIASLPTRQQHETPWHEHLSLHAARCPQLYEEFDNGQIAYIPTGGGDYRDKSVYGDAIVPLAFVEREWSPYFDVRDYIDDPGRFFQAVLIVQRRNRPVLNGACA